MKILLTKFCNHCLEEADRKNEKYDFNPQDVTLVELNDEGVYSFRCSNNHTQWTFTAEEIFQILYDLGIRSLCDGYTREAFANFVTALERFYEFMIRIFLIAQNISEETLEKYWKYISRQSERQFSHIYLFMLIKLKNYLRYKMISG